MDLMELGSKRAKFPYVVDFSALPDGPLPGAFGSVPTWAVSGGVATCTPTEEIQARTNPDFEVDPWTGWSTADMSGARVADPRPGSSGFSSWQLTATAANGYISQTQSGILLDFWRWSAWVKRISGTGYLIVRLNGGGTNGKYASSTSWEEVTSRGFRASGGSFYPTLRMLTSGDVFAVDDSVLTKLTGVFAGVQVRPGGYMTLKASIKSPNSGATGVQGLWFGDHPTNPQNGLYVTFYTADVVGSCGTRPYKFINGIPTALDTMTRSFTYGTDGVAEVRRVDDSTYRCLYNGAQYTPDITVTEDVIRTARYAGFQSNGGAGQGINWFSIT